MNLRLIFNLMVCAALSGVLAPTDAMRVLETHPFSHRILSTLNQSRRCESAFSFRHWLTTKGGRLVWRG